MVDAGVRYGTALERTGKDLDWGTVTISLAVAALAAISFGSFVKGLTGLGLPLVAVPAIATFSSIEVAVVLMIIPGLGSNLTLVWSHRRFRALAYEHRAFLVAGFIGGIAGTFALVSVNDRWLRLVLAGWLALYLIQYFFGNILRRLFQARGAVAPVVGLCAGISQGATGISAQIIAPYFNGRNLEPAAYAFMVAAAFLSASFAQLVTTFSTDAMTPERLVLGVIALVPTLAFTRLGIRFSKRVSQTAFQRLLIVVFVVMEIKLLLDIFRQA